MTKSKTVATTYGGFVEWIWPDEFDAISCSHSTGAFMSPDTGLAASDGNTDSSGIVSFGRKGTIAWERQEDLLELFRNNGIVYDSNGKPALRGRVMMLYDRGIFTGHFTNFTVDEDDSHAFSFQLSWDFKVEKTLYRFPLHQLSDDSTADSQPNTSSGALVPGDIKFT